jgi:hypothetical protein
MEATDISENLPDDVGAKTIVMSTTPRQVTGARGRGGTTNRHGKADWHGFLVVEVMRVE